MNTIRDEWETYKQILPKDAGETQINETRLAFYGGVASTLFFMRDVVPTMSDDAGVEVLESWHQEILSFVRSI